MASQPKVSTRRRVRAPAPRTPPPVAIIDLTTDTPTPPPPPVPRIRFTIGNTRSHEVERPQYLSYEPDDSQDVTENISFPSYQGSYTSFSNEENLGGLFHSAASPIVLNESSNGIIFDQSRFNNDNNRAPVNNSKPADPAPAINDSVEGETVVLSCPICFEELRPTRKPTSTKCGHVFCEECLNATFIAHKKCPKCNAPIKRKSCIRLFL
ncbi:uncharacterized protein LOC122848332 isoform X2 [Aphidius gifuensis]|nr:uncharacterized protein LOC122848332 isoform X2 [Aphidius gifuensis]